MRISKKDLDTFAGGNYNALNKYNKPELATLYKNLGGEIKIKKNLSNPGNRTRNAVYYGPGNRMYNKNHILEDLSMILSPRFTMNNAKKYFPSIKNKYS